MKKQLLIVLLTLALGVGVSVAQDDTTTTTTTGPQNNINFLIVVCADQVVANFNGFMLPGYDVYYQAFTGADGSGNALTALRQVQVNGEYAVSERAMYVNEQTVAAGQSAGVRVRIAREGNADSIDFETVVSDVQDGCSNPQNTETSSVDLGGASTGTTTSAGTAGGLLVPGGGVLNPNLGAEGQVHVGARPSDHYRSQTAGMIFAHCNNYTQAAPGVLYDSDPVTIYWSWYAKTKAQIQQQIDHAQFSVKVNQTPLPNAQLSEPQLINGDYWVFYQVPLNYLAPGHYEVEFRLTWDAVISDGYGDFGPGTWNDKLVGQCNFNVRRDPVAHQLPHNRMFHPTAFPTHHLYPGYEGGESGIGEVDQVNYELGQICGGSQLPPC